MYLNHPVDNNNIELTLYKIIRRNIPFKLYNIKGDILLLNREGCMPYKTIESPI